MINKLSEKDELIKSLREKQIDNKDLKKAIDTKLKALADNKKVNK